MNIREHIIVETLRAGGPGSGRRPEGGRQNEIDKMKKPHPGAVCSNCGKTVSEGEYSEGQSNCCKQDVVPEEEYGK